MQTADLSHLAELNDDYELTGEQISSYQQNGHIVLRNVANDAEIADYRPAITGIVRELNNQSKPIEERDTYGKAFIQIGNLWQHDQTVARFVTARRFAKIAADLMGVSGVRIYHDQALFKEPGGGFTPWHQDQNYWPLDTNHTITLWMPLVPVSAEVGSMTFVSGTHKQGYISRQLISDESHRTLAQYVAGKQLPQVTYGALAAGDATFHAGWTLHCAPGNPSDRMREVMTIIYMAEDTRVLEPDSNARRTDMEACIPGRGPGDLADSYLNPVVFSRL